MGILCSCSGHATSARGLLLGLPELTYPEDGYVLDPIALPCSVYDAEYWMDEAEITITVTSDDNQPPVVVGQNKEAEEDTEYYIVLRT